MTPAFSKVCSVSSVRNILLSKIDFGEEMVAVGLAGAAAAPVVVGAALGAAGFTAAGVAAGSWAAGAQAAMGNVAAGSWFAAAQSAGAAGLGAAGATAGGAAAGAGAAATGAGYMTSACSMASLSFFFYSVPAMIILYSLTQ